MTSKTLMEKNIIIIWKILVLKSSSEIEIRKIVHDQDPKYLHKMFYAIGAR